MSDVKPGVETSEFQVAKSSGIFAYFSLVAATVIAQGPEVLGWLPEGSKAGAIVAAVVAAFGIAQKLFVELGYMHSRTQVKKAAYNEPIEPAE